ncbi:MAG: hypothetical protein FJ096_01205 [Deltaproteobacteria bacterium]|nr:hypothetical protein [Deltaproteobacteria bacterium]
MPSPPGAAGSWFVALPVSAGRWYDALVGRAPSCLARVHREDLHATVAFLGPTGEERARRAFATLEGRSSPSLDASLGMLVPLGSSRRPSALSLTLEDGNDAVAALIGSLRDAMFDAAEVPRDPRAALPHITIFRVPQRATSRDREASLAWAASVVRQTVSVRFETIALYTRAPEGSLRRFRTVIERRLG